MMPDVLVITDKEPLMNAIKACLALGQPLEVSGMLWSQTPVFLNPDILRESNLVVVELYREYTHGRRAEAVVLAERWLGITPFLILAPLYWSSEINCPGYWDMAAPDTLQDRVVQLIRNSSEAGHNLELLKTRVAQALAIPKQH